MRIRGLSLIVLVVLCAVPGSAAASLPVPVPVNAPVVARDGAVVLTATDGEGRLCVGFADTRSVSEACGGKGGGVAVLGPANGSGDRIRAQ